MTGHYVDRVFTVVRGGKEWEAINMIPMSVRALAFVGASGPGVRILYQPDPDDENAFAFDKQLQKKPLKLQVEEHGGALTLTNAGPTSVRVKVIEKR